MRESAYKILGVSPGVKADKIQNAYRKLCVVYHPDKQPKTMSSEEKARYALKVTHHLLYEMNKYLT